MRSEHARGFTLLELMIATVMVAVLTTLAVSAYRDFVLRSQRNDAHAALLRVQAEQERHFLAHHRYAADLEGPAQAEGLALASTSEHGYYELTMQLTKEGRGFVVTAAPLGRQREDRRCTSLSIDETGRRDATGAVDAAIRCWR